MPRVRDTLPILPYDPLKFQQLCWPHIRLYDRQWDIVYSVLDNKETIVPAGNDLGKDFVSGFIAVYLFCSRTPCRIVTSSVDGSQLEAVLWGEIRNFLRTSVFKLPIIENHLHLHQIVDGLREPKSEVVGRVVRKGEGLLGRHLPWNKDEHGHFTIPTCFAIFDEASGIDDIPYNTSDTWTHRKLVIGNPYPCENFFKRHVKAGDLPDPHRPGKFLRKIIQIKAVDSPNVRRAMFLRSKYPGMNRMDILKESTIIPGALDLDTYEERRLLWDPMKQSIGLEAEFYEGAEVKLYPPDWLNYANQRATELHYSHPNPHLRGSGRKAKAMGVDSGEGTANSVWTVVDEKGILEQYSVKTTNTADIPGITVMLMRKWGLQAHEVFFDRGGGGKQHADQLRNQGYEVRTVGFGETVDPDYQYPQREDLIQRRDKREQKTLFKNRRAEMYGVIRFQLIECKLDPDTNQLKPTHGMGFGIPAEYKELRRQMNGIPLKWDEEGRMWLPPKHKKDPSSNTVTLVDILGASPDELDSFALAAWGLFHVEKPRVVGLI